ncbi:C1D-domain-containing protein [Auriscalpium vulgare]|uniref:C1D-domain-containing protein n=1 Tax=Auriscalpium vulgare TaxID=40419 RepID=A0ACB8RZF8_9AGAM|nr:C1D-domain-containing protein [Auriscalpium vulgare]
MADDTAKIKKKLATLMGSLGELETALEPLFAQSLPETVLGLETIQQAKLQVAIPYLVYDLVFIYLKTQGIDPKTHPVIAELDRVRQYFDKIKEAEDPAKRQFAVDKAAATRFIKHAINQAKNTEPVAGPSIHVRFDADGTAQDMREREEYQKRIQEEESGDEEEEGEGEGLQIIDDDAEDSERPAAAAAAVDRKGKGKASSAEVVAPAAGAKRRRPAMDPFADVAMEDAPPLPSSATDSPDKKAKKKKKKRPITG